MPAHQNGTSKTGYVLSHLICKPLKNLTIMHYIIIVALEFLVAFVGVGLLIRYYNHKA